MNQEQLKEKIVEIVHLYSYGSVFNGYSSDDIACASKLLSLFEAERAEQRKDLRWHKTQLRKYCKFFGKVLDGSDPEETAKELKLL